MLNRASARRTGHRWTASLDVVHAPIAAICTRCRDRLRSDADLGQERLRFFMCWSNELRVSDNKRYEYASAAR